MQVTSIAPWLQVPTASVQPGRHALELTQDAPGSGFSAPESCESTKANRAGDAVDYPREIIQRRGQGGVLGLLS